MAQTNEVLAKADTTLTFILLTTIGSCMFTGYKVIEWHKQAIHKPVDPYNVILWSFMGALIGAFSVVTPWHIYISVAIPAVIALLGIAFTRL
jgi:hypothetical protein